jgi:protein involved in sex pheromone biosynthesis
MKKQLAIAALSIGLLVTACNNTVSDNPTAQKEKELFKKETELNKHDDPVKVVEEIFNAAKSNDFSILSGLCDPKGGGDADVKEICDLSSRPKERQDDFKNYFSKGQVIGSAEITGDKAKVKIKFGPDGTKDEEFNLVRIDGKWYISSF